jgi:hypothetical protein
MGCYETFDDETDSDSDDISDYEEGVVYGSDYELADTDGDGIDDGDELYTGTDLLDADSVFAATVAEISNSSVTLTWPSAAGLYYKVYSCTNLVSDEWVSIGVYGATSPENTAVITTDDETTFYRLSVTDIPTD